MPAEMQAQARKLLEGTTEGRWFPYRKWNGDHDIHARTPQGDVDDTDTVLMIRCAATPEDAALAAAAPTLARQVDSLADEVMRLRAERDAYRGVVTKLANLSTNYPMQAVTPEMLSQLYNAADTVTQDHGCEDCAGLTLDDGILCCWTCTRAIPDAPAQEAQP